METGLTKLLGIKYPIMCAGMAHVTGAELAAAVSNAGGIGTIGAIGLNPKGLRTEIQRVKALLHKGNSICGTLPFGIDLLLPKVGGNARKTNKDYTGGQLEELVQVMVDEKVPLFVCAVGVPEKWVVDKLHAAGIIVGIVVGAPNHCKNAIDANIDLIIATGGEGGGHAGDISTLVLVPQCADMCRGSKAVLVGGGGVYDGRGIAACLTLGAQGVWIGTRFISTNEANCNLGWHTQMLKAKSGDTIRSEIYTGRPLRCLKTKHNMDWAKREAEQRELMKKGVIPMMKDIEDGVLDMTIFVGPLTRKYADIGKNTEDGEWNDIKEDLTWNIDSDQSQAGQAVGAVNSIIPAALVVKEMMSELVKAMQMMGRLGSQFSDAKFNDIDVPNTGTFTLENLHTMVKQPNAKL